MAAYWIARAKVNDQNEYMKYANQVPGILEKFNGKILTRGGDQKTLEGREYFDRFIVIEFASMEDAESCFNSEEYKSAAKFRRQNNVGDNELTIVEAGDLTPRP
ncbi:MAG: hypothetical protein CFH41_02788 [Alphaproteobacteria bacterium MarineAlpha11_Bin1]|nr:MAG: hypothetical protein CFH41_02788 [Alphaproteobacteria bacterium MarineAlpha11_Bin1]|tara:strand:- start:6391 stop:6702 length:312 start_codon:yes stop_codon:yes gene_type:complete